MRNITEDLSEFEKKNIESKLMASFLEAKEEPTFAKLVEKLKLPYEELAKYTSMLEDSAKEYEHCLHCKNLLECQNKIEGHAYLPEVKEKKLRFGYKPCKFQLKEQKECAHFQYITVFGQSEEIKKANFKDLDVSDKNRLAAIREVTNFIEDYRAGKKQKGLYLHGNFGSGKTFLVCAMLNELAKDAIKSAIVFWPEFLTSLKASFGTDEFREILEEVKHTKILLIDDLGAENTTSWSRDDVLCPILQYRMDEKLPTFFTSNFTLEELEQHLSISKDGIEVVKAKRIMERIKQLAKDVELNGKNLRES